MKSRRMIGFLILVVLCCTIMGCVSAITREYGARSSSIHGVMNNMTQDKAIKIFYRFYRASVQWDQAWQHARGGDFIKRAGGGIWGSKLHYTLHKKMEKEPLQRQITCYNEKIRRWLYADN